MLNTTFKIAALGFALMACQDPNFQPGSTDVGQQTSDDEERFRVGGAFLHCNLVERSDTELSVGCGLLKDQEFIKIADDLDVEMRSVTVDDQEQIIESTANEERTMWTTTVAMDSQIKTLILVFRKGPWNRSFKASFPVGASVQLSNFRLGDNPVVGSATTVVEPNPCLEIEAAQQEGVSGGRLMISFVVDEATELNIQITEACGIEVDQGLTLGVLGNDVAFSFQQNIPNGSTQINAIKLAPGTYSLSIDAAAKSPTDLDDTVVAKLFAFAKGGAVIFDDPQFLADPVVALAGDGDVGDD